MPYVHKTYPRFLFFVQLSVCIFANLWKSLSFLVIVGYTKRVEYAKRVHARSGLAGGIGRNRSLGFPS